MTDTRFEIVPLEALRVKPGEVLVLRLPGHWTMAHLDEIRDTLKACGIEDREKQTPTRRPSRPPAEP